ncbi:Protein MKS1 [Raphanus sativus]|uniref:Protein MKS1-like n=1 Tax=Raphanus sativus TaxID=3726 RepID=A0A9W3CUI1_RAPSA|nr:protein MKS1-like [Raphanus sativus]KAJ4869035.1 Protein MKS1 [Raphanus sativus]
MDPSEFFGGGNTSDQQNQKRQLQIYGQRPSPLSVHKDSHKIKKPPKHPAPPPRQHRDQDPLYAAREPVVIYAVSPKVVHTTASDFMNVVQRLTGISSAVFLEPGNGGDVSPAARLAATENASPRGGKEPAPAAEISTAMEEAAEFSGYAAPGILSPSPAMLPTASTGIFSQMGGMFSPGIPPGLFSPAGLMSPFGFGSWVASPTFADVFSHIWDS